MSLNTPWVAAEIKRAIFPFGWSGANVGVLLREAHNSPSLYGSELNQTHVSICWVFCIASLPFCVEGGNCSLSTNIAGGHSSRGITNKTKWISPVDLIHQLPHGRFWSMERNAFLMLRQNYLTLQQELKNDPSFPLFCNINFFSPFCWTCKNDLTH